VVADDLVQLLGSIATNMTDPCSERFVKPCPAFLRDRLVRRVF